jgi:hypothetical protein
VGGPLVAALDGLRGCAAGPRESAWPARRVERFLAAQSEQVHERAHDPRDGPVVGAVGDGRVQRRVLHHAGAPLQDLLVLLLEDPLHFSDLLPRGAAGG